MSTLEQRVLEAIEATGLNPADLATKIGISKQGVYDWKRGESLAKMKGENLVELAELSGFEPLWIMKGKGVKKKFLTDDEKKVLQLVAGMSDTAKQHWIAIGTSLTSVIPTTNAVDTERRTGEDRRKVDVGFNPERRHFFPAPNFPQKDKIYTDRRKKQNE